jgi:uncharacterized protein YtpQ (UPF0354 family)
MGVLQPGQQPGREFADVRARLYPLLMSPAAVQEKGGGQMVAALLAEGLCAVYVEDLDRYRVRYITNDDLKHWGVSQTALHSTSVRNLEEATRTLQFARLDNPERPNPMFVWNRQDARLLLYSYMKDFSATVSGQMLVAVPDRHWLVAIGDRDAALVDRVQRLVRQRHRQEEFPVSPHLYRWEEGKLRLWQEERLRN